jgi:hypothetical protein
MLLLGNQGRQAVVRSLVCSTVFAPRERLTTVPWSFFGVRWGVSSKSAARGQGSGPNMAALTVHPNILFALFLDFVIVVLLLLLLLLLVVFVLFWFGF